MIRYASAVLSSAVVSAAALFTVGCQSSPPPIVEVEGVVMLDGKPLPGAELLFAPTMTGFGAEIMSTAVTDDAGRFILRCGDKAGAAVGEHRVVVQEGPIPDKFRGMDAAAQVGAGRYLAELTNRPIPAKYSSFAQTPLKVMVKTDQKEYTLELSR